MYRERERERKIQLIEREGRREGERVNSAFVEP